MISWWLVLILIAAVSIGYWWGYREGYRDGRMAERWRLRH